MEPFIHTGEYIKCSPENIENLNAGDPVVFWRDNKLICHFLLNIIEKDEKRYLETKGLNAKIKDPLVPIENFFAVVTSPKISPLKRRIFSFLSYFQLKP
jgi:hypothetical protein